MPGGEIVLQLAEKSGVDSAEIDRLIGEKKRKFAGLLTDNGAAFMVAKDLGVELGLESMRRVHISQLRDGMQNVDLLARVMQVGQPKLFEKNAKKGKLCNLVVADDTGEIRLTVWHDDVETVLRKGVKRGGVLLLRNCYVKSFNERLQLSLAYNGSIDVNPQGIVFDELPDAKSAKAKISELNAGMNDVCLVARALRVFPATEFEKGGRKGSVVNFLIADETGIMRATAWNDFVQQVLLLEENDLVEIEGAYTKQGLKAIELHLGWQARIEKVSETESAIPSVLEMMKAGAERKKIQQLAAGDENVLVEGKIIAVNQGALYYNVCPNCAGKIQALEEGIVCERCGEVKEPDIRLVVSVMVDDGTAQVSAVAYGKEAEKIIGLEKNELKKQVEERGRDALIEELQEMAGRKIEVIGTVKQNSFSGGQELVARLVELK